MSSLLLYHWKRQDVKIKGENKAKKKKQKIGLKSKEKKRWERRKKKKIPGAPGLCPSSGPSDPNHENTRIFLYFILFYFILFLVLFSSLIRCHF